MNKHLFLVFWVCILPLLTSCGQGEQQKKGGDEQNKPSPSVSDASKEVPAKEHFQNVVVGEIQNRYTDSSVMIFRVGTSYILYIDAWEHNDNYPYLHSRRAYEKLQKQCEYLEEDGLILDTGTVRLACTPNHTCIVATFRKVEPVKEKAP